MAKLTYNESKKQYEGDIVSLVKGSLKNILVVESGNYLDKPIKISLGDNTGGYQLTDTYNFIKGTAIIGNVLYKVGVRGDDGEATIEGNGTISSIGHPSGDKLDLTIKKILSNVNATVVANEGGIITIETNKSVVNVKDTSEGILKVDGWQIAVNENGELLFIPPAS